MEVSETIRYRSAVISSNREGPQQRYDTVADDARLHNVLVHVVGIEPVGHVHHGIGFFTEEVRPTGNLFGRKGHDDLRPTSGQSVPLVSSPILGWVYSRVTGRSYRIPDATPY